MNTPIFDRLLHEWKETHGGNGPSGIVYAGTSPVKNLEKIPEVPKPGPKKSILRRAAPKERKSQ